MKQLNKLVLKNPLKLMVLLFIAITISSCESPNFEKPANTITVKKAKELSNNFDVRHDTISALIGKPDNRSSWHSLAELEQYIAYIKKEGANKGLDVDGIRIYFGAYGPNEEGRENYSTLFLVPTVKATTVPGVKNFAAVSGDSGDTEELQPLNLGNQGNPPSNKY